MRVFLLGSVFVLTSASAFAQATIVPPSVQAWDQCVGESAQDYVDMFGAVSMDADKMDKAVEDCWDEEFRFSQELKQERPDLSDSTIANTVAAQRADIRGKWYAHYVTNRKGFTRASTR